MKWKFKYRVEYILGIFGFVKVFAFKFAFSMAVARLAWLTRKGLLESARIFKKQQKLLRQIFLFSLIPLFINAVFTVPEVLN